MTGTVWRWLLSPSTGIESLVHQLGWTSFKFDWLVNREMAIYTVVITGIWQASGFVMALFLAGLRSVDPDLIKAAQIDGASMPRIYRRIILPAIGPIFVAVLVVLLQSAIKIFDLVIALTGGGPGIATTVPSIYVYDLIFQRGQMAEGAAAAMMILFACALYDLEQLAPAPGGVSCLTLPLMIPSVWQAPGAAGGRSLLFMSCSACSRSIMWFRLPSWSSIPFAVFPTSAATA